jgi:hypothetical protein
MVFREKIHSFQVKMFNLILASTYLLYIVIALGLSAKAPQYLNHLLYFTKIYVSLFLIYRFNPFRNVEFTNLDRKIAFSAGTFLIATIAIDEIIKNLLEYFNKGTEFISRF